jgi:uncharacterized protein YjbI with pentapeptide repeats
LLVKHVRFRSLVTGKLMTSRRPIGRPLIVLAALGMAAGTLVFSGGPASADVTCPTVSGGTVGTVSPAPTPGVDWQGCDLSYADLGGADLANANLSNALLRGAQLTNASLTDASLTNANFVGAILDDTNMTDANLANAELLGATFYQTDLTDANLADADMEAASLGFVTVTGTDLTGAYLGGVTGVGLIGTPSSLPAHWSIRYDDLMGPGANLSDVPLTGDDLAGIDLAGADLEVVQLASSNLTGANLSHTTWTYGDLAGANLTDANLTDSTLISAHVNGTKLAGADLTGVTGSALTGTPSSLPAHWSARYGDLMGPGANLPRASLIRADLAGVDLAGANLSDGQLADANLTGANLSKANLSDAYLGGVNFTRATLAGADLYGTQTSGAIWSDTTCANGLNSSLYSNGCNTLQLWGFGGFRSPARKSSLPVSAHEVTVTFRLHFTNGKPVTASAASWLVSHRLIRATLTGQNIKAVNASCTWKTAAKEFSCVVKLPKGIKTGKAHPYWITVAENLGHGFRTAPPDRGMVNPEYVYFK